MGSFVFKRKVFIVVDFKKIGNECWNFTSTTNKVFAPSFVWRSYSIAESSWGKGMHENWLTFCKDFPFRFLSKQLNLQVSMRCKMADYVDCLRHHFSPLLFQVRVWLSFCCFGTKKVSACLEGVFVTSPQTRLARESFHSDWCTSGFIDLCHKNSWKEEGTWKVSLTITGLTQTKLDIRSSQNKMSISPIKS